jgi:S1-C subfamily serine protease
VSTAFSRVFHSTCSAVTLDKPKALAPIASSGTGFFITKDGYLLTNHHVVEDGRDISVRTDKGDLPAKVVKVDKKNDLAVLKVEGKFAALPLLSSRKAGLSEQVFTVGFPRPKLQGFSPKFTDGVSSSPAGIQDDPRDFQISVPVQPGNSGGQREKECRPERPRKSWSVFGLPWPSGRCGAC